VSVRRTGFPSRTQVVVVLFKLRPAVHDQLREFLRHDAWNPAVSGEARAQRIRRALPFSTRSTVLPSSWRSWLGPCLRWLISPRRVRPWLLSSHKICLISSLDHTWATKRGNRCGLMSNPDVSSSAGSDRYTLSAVIRASRFRLGAIGMAVTALVGSLPGRPDGFRRAASTKIA
jgi:hypothetical protein